LGDQKKQELGRMLEAVYAGINDPELTERMAYYARTQPGERTNELHSILATEYVELGSELETYFKQYFNDRLTIVALHAGYKFVFDTLRTQSDTLSNEMIVLKQQIDAGTAQYNLEADLLSVVVDDLQSGAQTVDRSSAAEVNSYNAQRRVIVARIDALSTLGDAINTNVSAYNEKVKKYNALITNSNELIQSLDSTLVPAPGI